MLIRDENLEYANQGFSLIKKFDSSLYERMLPREWFITTMFDGNDKWIMDMLLSKGLSYASGFMNTFSTSAGLTDTDTNETWLNKQAMDADANYYNLNKEYVLAEVQAHEFAHILGGDEHAGYEENLRMARLFHDTGTEKYYRKIIRQCKRDGTYN